MNQINPALNQNIIQLPNPLNMNSNAELTSQSNILNSFLLQNQKVMIARLNKILDYKR